MAPAECRAFLRVILAAVAISCTLSIPRDQGTQRLTQIKDMICVIILSGMQKEDLEVSMLRKLQRYSVNIDDMNNEQHRQECLSKNKDFTSEKIDNTYDNYIPSTVRTTTAVDDPLRDLSITAVLNYLKNKQSTKLEKTTTSLDLQREMDTRAAEYFMNQTKSNINLLQRYIQLENLNSSMYEVDHSYKTTSNNNYKNQNINIEVDEIKAKGVKDNELINTIFKDYLIQTKRLPTTTETPITRGTIDIQNVYKRIEELISDSNADNKNVNEKIQSNISQNNQYFISSTGLPQEQTTFNRDSQIKNFYDFLSTIKQFKSYSSIVSPQNNPTAYAIKTKKYGEKNIMSTTKQVKYEKIISNEPEIDADNRKAKAITSDLVKEIAKTVKDVIIKDLRDELSNIYREPAKTITFITTTTTTDTPSTKTSKIITRDKEFAIMDTFMELYEQIKALKHNTFVLDAHNKSVTTANDFIQESKIIIKNPPVVNYNELQKPENKLSMYGDYNTRQYSNLNPYHTRQIKNLHIPITIQTNSVEIQPLAVPISKPDSLINQNIVVNSRQSIQHRNNHARHIPRNNRFSDIRFIHRNRTHKYSPVKRHEGLNVPRDQIRTGYEELRHDDVIRFRMENHGNSKNDTDYYEKINFGDNYKAGDNVHNVDFGNHNIPRYHERLERIDDRFPALSDKDIDDKRKRQNDDVPERQQLSLIDMKKGTSYDDTHFKNFLKTQQKVTDILERILATRPKTNTPRSVETA